MGVVRLDKYLANLGFISRRQINRYIKKGYIQVNGYEIKKSDIKLNYGDIISFFYGDRFLEIQVKQNIVVLLNKPKGYICSDKDEGGYLSYKHLLVNCPYVNILKIAGRLDVDTEGLLVLSDNGNFIHKLISPKFKKEKLYFVELINSISEEDGLLLEKGIDIGGYITLPSKIYNISYDIKKLFYDINTFYQIPELNLILKGKKNNGCLISIVEGKYHQIKKMFEVVGNKVVYLKRLKVDKFELGSLKKGEWTIL